MKHLVLRWEGVLGKSSAIGFYHFGGDSLKYQQGLKHGQAVVIQGRDKRRVGKICSLGNAFRVEF